MLRAFSPIRTFAALLLAGLLALTACSPSQTAPTPLPLAEIPAELRKAFAQAKPDTKQRLDQMLSALDAKDYPAAYQGGESISAAPGITKAQMMVTARALLEVHRLLQEATAQGDPRAAGFMDYQRHNR